MTHFKSNRLQFKRLLLLLSTLLFIACGTPNKKSSPIPTPEPVKPAAVPVKLEREYIPHDPADEIPLEAPPQPRQKSVQARLAERYTVKRGDTLWGIAKHLLNDPWLWPKVWHINPEIQNPHLIYPGDTVALYDVDGKPFLTLEGSKGAVLPQGVTTLKWSPRIRSKSLGRAVTTLPRELIAPFLNRNRVVDGATLAKAPQILSSYEGHLIAGSGNKVYAMDIDQNTSLYTIVRPGATYRDPDVADKILGYEAIQVADARVVRGGQPATLVIGQSNQEILNGDRLLPYEEQTENFYFFPSSPKTSIDARIISAMGGVSLIGQYSVVVINKGEGDGLIPGHVLAIYQKGEEVRDSVTHEAVKLPDDRAGLMMVFRTFNKVSYGLVLNAERSMAVLDRVGNP